MRAAPVEFCWNYICSIHRDLPTHSFLHIYPNKSIFIWLGYQLCFLHVQMCTYLRVICQFTIKNFRNLLPVISSSFTKRQCQLFTCAFMFSLAVPCMVFHGVLFESSACGCTPKTRWSTNTFAKSTSARRWCSRTNCNYFLFFLFCAIFGIYQRNRCAELVTMESQSLLDM